MSTSLLYHGFGIVGYSYIQTDYREGNIIFTLLRNKFNLRCPVCKGKQIIKHGSLPRWFQSLPIYQENLLAGLMPVDLKTINPAIKQWLECVANVRTHGETMKEAKRYAC